MKLLNTGNLYATEFIEHNHWDNEIWTNNLMINGTHKYEDNYNFSDFVWDDVNKCLSRTSGYTGILFSSDYIKINPDHVYAGQLEMKNGNPGNPGKALLGFTCCDSQLRDITHTFVYHYANTRTYLAADLNNTDTTAQLVNSINWKDSSQLAHLRYVGIWDTGEYPDYTYTRTIALYSDINYDTHVITLNSAWTGGNVPEGTAVANNYGGNVYIYRYLGSWTYAPDEWTLYGGPAITNTGWEINTPSNKFRYGTEYIRFIFLLNREASPATTTTLIRNMKFWNKTKNQIVYDKYDINQYTKTDQLKSREFNEIDLTSENPIMRITNDYQIQTKGEISEVV